MIIFLYGSDTYQSKQALNKIREKFIKENDSDITYLEANNLDINKLRNAYLSPNLFSKKRLIIIENLFSNKIKLQKTLIEKISNFIKNYKDRKNILVFWNKEIDEKKLTKDKNTLYKILKKEKYSTCFKLLKTYQTKQWIKNQIKILGFNLENSAIEFIIRNFGNDLWSINNELNKIYAYSKDKKNITLLDVKKLTKINLNDNIWNLVDSLGQKNKKLALKLLSDQIKEGISIDWIISMLARQLRIIAKIKLSSENNRSAKNLGLHPFVYQKALFQEKKYTLDELKKIYHRLTKVDFLRKTKKISPEVLLDLLIITS